MKTLVMKRPLVFLAVASVLTSAALAQAPDRTRPPKVGPPPSLKMPAIKQLKLSNGLPSCTWRRQAFRSSSLSSWSRPAR